MPLEVQPNPISPAAPETGQASAAPARGRTPAAAGKGGAASAAAVSHDKLNAAVDRLNRQVQEIRRSLQFVIDKASGEVVVKVVDTDTNEVISQIPPHDILALREHLKKLSGLLLHAQA